MGTCLSKSPNKHNRLYLVATPMEEELNVAIEDGSAGPKAEVKERARMLREKFSWDENAARKIWCWGPETEGANIVVDTTTAVQYINEIKEHVNSAFQWVTKEGPLCEENMRGIRFNLTDVTMHADSIHRGAGQIMPPTRRCCFAAELTAKPTLQEPFFLVEITCPQEAMSGVYNCMNLRRGCVFEENPREGTPLIQVKAHLPVSESFGFSQRCAKRPVAKPSRSAYSTTGRTCQAMPWRQGARCRSSYWLSGSARTSRWKCLRSATTSTSSEHSSAGQRVAASKDSTARCGYLLHYAAC